MQGYEKKKRSSSGSRLMRKAKTGELEVDFRGNPGSFISKQLPKSKSGKNSSHHSKPSRKNSVKQSKKHSKSDSNKEAKDARSHSISADRKRSLQVKNRTELNFENEEIQKFTFRVRLKLKQLKLPYCFDFVHLMQYFEQLRQCFSGVENSLLIFCMELHNYYTAPLQPLFEALKASQDLARRKQEISKLIDHQVNTNECLWEKMSPVDMEIFRMRQKIEENRSKIQIFKRQKLEKNLSRDSLDQDPASPQEYDVNRKLLNEFASEEKGNGLRLNFTHIEKEKPVGFHEQFYANIQNFSESWRQQALREKRY